ncbi:phage holin family protein [Agrococcus sp. ARC_14]|uniref:phage holin family protein n=1 Tax=Agrococcus sp. ARC_14 TaxID=2919927 RepID=UPI001F061EA1|nr:phage holin family protein [Agrococcus sp. ARC_14]MCH1881714.1 phage holin family protein [Agrococcus sp. ARC_14]
MTQRKSFGDLISETPKLMVELVKAEIDNLKSEVTGKAKGLGVGGALLAVAGLLSIFLISWLLYAGYEGLNVVFVPWLSALLLSAGLLVIIAILALIGLSSIKKNKDFNNLEAVDSIKDDVNMVRGLGHAADGSDPLNDLDTTGVQR